MPKQSLLKNFLSLVGAEAFSKLITFATFAYLARLFGPAGFGYIEWAGSVLMCASLIVDQGFSAYGAREIAKAPEQTSKLVTEVVTARFLLAAVGYLAVVLFALLFTHSAVMTQLLLVYGLSLWVLPLLLQWVFQGHDRMHLVAVAQIIRQTIFVAVVFAFVRSERDLLLVGMAEVAGVTCAAMFTMWMYRRNFTKNLSLRPALSIKLFREGVPIGISQMFWVVKMFGATLIVGLIATADDTGYFAGAMRIFIALHTFVWLYYFNLLPSLSRAWEQGREKFSDLIGNSMRIVALVSLSGGIIWVLVAPFVMTSVYGQSFSHGSGALQWLAGACIAAAISGHYRFGLIAAGHQSKEMLASVLGAVVTGVLIPLGYFKAGTNGAAAALCFAEVVVLLFSWLITRRVLFSANTLLGKENCLGSLPEVTR
jgi:PST family polysaccharide transporter